MTATRARRYVEPGDSVCVVVSNAHPVFYAYSMAAETLKVASALPAAPLLLELAKEATIGALSVPADTQARAWDAIYLERLEGFALALTTSRALGIASDAAEEAGTSGSNFLRAVASIRSHLDDIPQRQPGETMQRMLDRWYQEAKAKHDTSRISERRLLGALQGYGAGLLAQAQTLEKTWSGEGAPFRSCVVVNRESIRIRIAAAVRDADHAKARRTGPIAVIDVTPKYRVERVAVTPTFTLSLSGRGDPNYQVRNGAVVDIGDSDRLLPQPGAILSALLTQWGADDSYLLRAGLGSNIVRTDDRLDRLFGAVTVGYRDVLAVGLGVGRVRRQVLTDTTILGKPLAAGAKLEDLLGKPDNRPAYYLTIDLANLDALAGLAKLVGK